MTAALFAALAGLVGVMIGRLWDTRSESTRWRRDQKTANYQRVIEQFQATYEAIRVVALTETDAEAFQALIEHTRSGGFAAWDSAVAAVWLHGSTDVVVAVTDLDEALGALFSAATDRQIQDRTEWNQARQPAGAAFEQFVNAARRELDLSPAPVRVFHSAQTLPTTGRDSAAITEQRWGS